MDADTLTSLVGPELTAVGQEHLAQGRISDLDSDDGGASAVAADPAHGELDVWVGVVDGELTGECDCPDRSADAPCAHAVAVALAALEEGIQFSSIPGRDSGEAEQRLYAEVAGRLRAEELIGLVARQAVADRRFAALLLSCAGELAEPSEAELAAVREQLDAAAELVTEADWEPYEVIKAGQAVLAELELLAIRPATDEFTELAEEAADTWITLAEALADSEAYTEDAEDIAEALAALMEAGEDDTDEFDEEPEEAEEAAEPAGVTR
jgi:hypothetical protein